MSKIGFIGLGKLGLPVALAIESRGHQVAGYDINPEVANYVENKYYPFQEIGIEELLENTKLKVVNSVLQIARDTDIIFLPVQTPHEARFEGTQRLPEERADFDYDFLKAAITDVVEACKTLKVKRTLVVISTCLPGTFKRELKPLLNEYVDYVYSPQFIAMGQVIDDYLNPEFNLIGVESEKAADQLEKFYKTINDAPNVRTDITTAEGIKVSYNTWITAKTVIANAWGELSDKLGMNFDDIYKAWSLSTKRLISPRYMKAGMGDGGGCHPRDNIALSHLASEVGLSHNIFEDLMEAREDFEDYHARQAMEASKKSGLPLVILGRSFKPETQIETGSPAILMANLLKEYGYPFEHVEDLPEYKKAVYFIATNHERYKDIDFPEGSVLIIPFQG
jgi:UDPglucose 6-dehydrogenase